MIGQHHPSAPIKVAVARIAERTAAPLERAEALADLALSLQRHPKSNQDIVDAVYLYDQALSWANGHPLAQARILAGKGASLRRMPGCGPEELQQAHDALDRALAVLRNQGEAEETAETEMVYGLVLQALAPLGHYPLRAAVAAYQRALKVFNREGYPREYAIIHNNLATAYLALQLAPEKAGMREALAVRSFREALSVVSLEEDPHEYAMLQNNLGNALQAIPSPNRLENLQRALEAYDEALKVRTVKSAPLEYANTLANKANALMNIPDDWSAPQLGNPQGLSTAIAMLEEAERLFEQHFAFDRAAMVHDLAQALRAELVEQHATSNDPGTKATP